MSLKNIYHLSPLKRTIIMWIVFQLILWIVFGVSAITHQDAWLNVMEVNPNNAAVGGWITTFAFIIISNLLICILIAVGNLFVRFGVVTPGFIVLIVQAFSIGWIAGSNQFEVPFATITDANLAYLKIGLWETTAYIVTCAITLPKSLYIADSFPATRWLETKKISAIKFNKTEKIIFIIGILSLVIAALIETYKLL